jgi:hypothetical protein
MTTQDLHLALLDCDPSIVTIHEPYFLLKNYKELFSVNPQFLAEGEDQLIISKIRELQAS